MQRKVWNTRMHSHLQHMRANSRIRPELFIREFWKSNIYTGRTQIL